MSLMICRCTSHAQISNQVLIQVDRTGSNVSVVPVKEAKTHDWQNAIHQLCIDSLISGNIPDPEVISFMTMSRFCESVTLSLSTEHLKYPFTCYLAELLVNALMY